MLEMLVALGTNELAKFVFDKILELGQGAVEDYTKDFFKEWIGEGVEFAKKPFVREGVGEAVGKFLMLIQEELKFHEVSQNKISKDYEKAIKQLVRDERVKSILGRAFKKDCKKIDAQALSKIWQQSKLKQQSFPPMPDEFDWEQVAKNYVREVKKIIKASPELRDIFKTETLEAIEENTDQLIGVVPDFDLNQYRDSLQDFYGYLNLDILNLNGYQYRMQLCDMFVPQKVHESLPLNDETSQNQENRKQFNQPVYSVLDIIESKNYNNILILGNPGSGKSTLSRYIALDWVRKTQIETSSSELLKPIPILIELRKYAQDRNKPKDFLDFLHQGSDAICHLNQLKLDEQLDTGNVFIIFDGLDEIFDLNRRETVITEIIRFTNKYQKTKVLVTSRKLDYNSDKKPARFIHAGFKHFTLEDFNRDQIQEFVDKWHDLALNNHPDKERLQDRLQSAIFNYPAIEQLAVNPLLLTMMAILNRNQELPRERSELYEQASRVLLHKWDIEKGLPAHEKLAPDTIRRKEKQEMLRRVAYFMHSSPNSLEGNRISHEDLEKVLTEYLETLEIEKPKTVSRLIIDQLRTRNFILCSYEDDIYGFIHRTFLEFFCAWSFVWQFEKAKTLTIEQLKSKIFGQYWRKESWHEVLRLIAGMVEPQFVGQIVDYLVEQNGEQEKYMNLFLAADCLSEVSNYSMLTNFNKLITAFKIAITERIAKLEKMIEQFAHEIEQLAQKNISISNLISTLYENYTEFRNKVERHKNSFNNWNSWTLNELIAEYENIQEELSKVAIYNARIRGAYNSLPEDK